MNKDWIQQQKRSKTAERNECNQIEIKQTPFLIDTFQSIA